MRQGPKLTRQMCCLCIWKEVYFQDVDGVLSVVVGSNRMTCFRLTDPLPLYRQFIRVLMLYILTMLRRVAPWRYRLWWTHYRSNGIVTRSDARDASEIFNEMGRWYTEMGLQCRLSSGNWLCEGGSYRNRSQSVIMHLWVSHQVCVWPVSAFS
jgi:hypothetical protein